MKNFISTLSFLTMILLAPPAHAVQGFLEGMAEAICRDQTHFVDCFDWSKETCESHAEQGLNMCRRAMTQPNSTDDQGQWGVDLGLCGETWLYTNYKIKDTPECNAHKALRTSDLDKAVFKIRRDQLIDHSGEIKLVMLEQFLITLFFSLGVPFTVAALIWRRKRPSKFPRAQGSMMIPLSVLGLIISIFAHNALGLLNHMIRLVGDNPTAIGGIAPAVIALIPLYWIGLYLIYRKFKSSTAG